MSKGYGYRLGYDQLGNLLLAEGLVTEDQLKMALDEQRRKGGRLGEIIVSLGFASEMAIMRLLGAQLGIPCLDLERGVGEIDPALLSFLPEQLLHRYQVFPLSREGRRLSLAMADPFDILAIDSLKALTGCEISPVIASRAGPALASPSPTACVTSCVRTLTSSWWGRSEIWRRQRWPSARH